MKSLKFVPLVCMMSLGMLGCDRPEKTVDQLRKEITEFRAVPDDQKSVVIEKNLAKLDSQILKLRTQSKLDQASFLQEQRDSLASDFGAAKVYRTLNDAKSALKGIQDVIQKTGEEFPNESPESASPAPSSIPETSVAPESSTPEAATPEASITPESTPLQQ